MLCSCRAPDHIRTPRSLLVDRFFTQCLVVRKNKSTEHGARTREEREEKRRERREEKKRREKREERREKREERSEK